MEVAGLHLPILALISHVSTLFPVIAGLARWKYLSRQMRTLFFLFLYDVVLTNVQLLLAYNNITNLWTWNITTLIEFVVIAWVFMSWMQNEHIKFAVKWCVGVIVAFWIIGKFSFEPVTEIPTYTSPVESAALVAMATYVVIILVITELSNTFQSEKFWVAIAIILYNAGTMPFVSVIYRILALPMEKITDFLVVNWSLAIVENVLVSIGFLCRSSKEYAQNNVNTNS